MTARIPAAQWLQVLVACGVDRATAATWSPAFERFVQREAFSAGAREIDDFVGQLLHETTMLRKLREDLNYTAKRMTEVWPGRFPTIAAALPYANNPRALANKTYGGRLGNVGPDDGWRYAGAGIPHVTGLAAYALLEKLTGLPLVAHPELIVEPMNALRCGLLWWEGHVPDEAIDTCERVTKAVQGGAEGLEHRRALTQKAGAALRPLLGVRA